MRPGQEETYEQPDAPPSTGRSRGQLALTLLKVASVLFVAEFAVMGILPLFGLRGIWQSATDSLLLALLALPALYALGFAPVRQGEVAGSRHSHFERRMLLLLAVYVCMVLIVIGAFGLLATGQEYGSKVINKAGRQRMLSQRLVKAAMSEAMEIAHADMADRKPGPQSVIAALSFEFEQALHGLAEGDPALGLPPCASVEAGRQLEVVREAWKPLQVLLRQTADPSSMDEAFAYFAALQTAGDRVLLEMEAAVKLLEQHYENRAKLLTTVLGLSIAAACGIGLMLAVTFRQMMRHRKRLDAVLAQSEAKIRAIVDAAADGIITIDERGTIDSFNAAAEQIFQYTADGVIGKNVSVLMPSPYRGEHDGYLRTYLSGAPKKVIGIRREVIGRRKDGSTFPMGVHVSEVHLGQRRVFTGIVRDITERRRLEGEILGISQREQQRIGQDLHDVMGQHLTGIAFLTKVLQKKLSDRTLPEAADASQIADMINETIIQARSLAKGLCPVDLTADGLMVALQECAANTEGLFGITCDFRCDEPVLIHDGALTTHLYRISQEAVNNAVKHGRATRIEIGMIASDGHAILTVKDDGVGLPDQLDADRGMGLRIMNYRARMIGATLDVRRDSEGGTTVTCTFPNDTIERGNRS